MGTSTTDLTKNSSVKMREIDETTLVIKHFPPDLSSEDRVDLLNYLGAVDVKCVSGTIKRSSCVFARFDTAEEATAVLHKLHQKRIRDSILSVEYGRGEFKTESEPTTKPNPTEAAEAFLAKLRSWTSLIDPSCPPPIHLRFKYPPVNRTVADNIAVAVLSVPKFYTQVLHLMNRMNLPCPLSPEFNIKLKDDLIGSDESEIESDSEKAEVEAEVEKPKRKFKEKMDLSKRLKVIQTAATKSTVKPEEVFELAQAKSSKKIELKLSKGLPVEPAITIDELNAGRIAADELAQLPVFQKYSPGQPSFRLYIKNVSREVSPLDLQRVYKRYTTGEDQFEIRLMTEGRMKGQAFVTLPSVAAAQQALTETNGFILKGKPLVVHFAKTTSS